jgi:integrase
MEAGGERTFLGPLVHHFGSTLLSKIDQRAIEAVARKLYPARKASTINRKVFTPISAVLNFAAKRGLCERRIFERPRQPKGRVSFLAVNEAERLIAACSPHLRPLIVFLLCTGARLSEALYLSWKDVDLARRHVVFLDTKNGEDRGVPLHPSAARELMAWT